MSGLHEKERRAILGPGLRGVARLACALLALGLATACDDDTAPADEITLALAPATVTVLPGGAATTIAKVRTDVTDPLHMTAIDVPAGLAVAITPEDLAGDLMDAKIIVTAAAEMAPGTYHLHLQAACDHAASHDMMLGITVVDPRAGGFTLNVLPREVTVRRDSTVSATVQLARIPPFTGPVAFSVRGLPDGVTGSFTPAITNGTSVRLDLVGAHALTAGDFEIEIVAKAAGRDEVIQPLAVVVPEPLFALVLAPDSVVLVPGGEPQPVTVKIVREAGFTGEVELVLTGVPTGLVLSQVPPTNVTGDEATLFLQASAGMKAGRQSMTVTGWLPTHDRSAGTRLIMRVEDAPN